MKERKHRRTARGSSVVEFALGFSVLWFMFSGVYQYGYSIFTYNNLSTSVRSAARFAARVDFDDPDHNFEQLVQNVAVYGTPAPSDSDLSIVPDLKPENVAVTWTRDGNGVPQTITVAVQNYELDAIFKTFKLDNRPRVTVKHAGLWKTPVGGGWEDK